MTASVTLAEQIAEAERWHERQRRETAEGLKLKVISPALAERQLALAAGIVRTLRWVAKHEATIKQIAAKSTTERGET